MIVPCQEQDEIPIPIHELLTPGGHLQLMEEAIGRDYFQLDLQKTRLRLRTRGHVGFIPLTDTITVHVRPRVPVNNLIHMLEVSELPATRLRFDRLYSTSSDWSSSLLDIYAEALADSLDVIAREGLYREYERHEDRTSFPRGRVLMGRTMQLHASGIKHAVASSWFERTYDNGVNRCLKLACHLIIDEYSKLSPSSQQSRLQDRLRACSYRLHGVLLDNARKFLDDPVVRGIVALPASRPQYQIAIPIARAIVLGQRIEPGGSADGPVRLPSLVMDMGSIFESYVRNCLQRGFATGHGTYKVHDGNSNLIARRLFNPATDDNGKQLVSPPRATPDIVVATSDDSAPPIILEVKYIPVSGGASLSKRESIEQAITYAVIYGSDRAVLVHPRRAENPSGLRYLGQTGTIRIYQYFFDLAAPSDEEESAFVAAVRSLAT